MSETGTKKLLRDQEWSREQLIEAFENNPSRPSTVPLGSLYATMHHFQARQDYWLYRDTVDALVEALTANPKHPIEPLVVFGDPVSPVVVDGHHRLAAYRKAIGTAKGISEKTKVKVRWAKSWDDAQRIVVADNTVEQKALSQSEKVQNAWRKVVGDLIAGVLWDTERQRWSPKYSKAQQATFYGVSPETIANMRRVLMRVRRVFLEGDTSNPHVAAMDDGDPEVSWIDFLQEDDLWIATASWPGDVLRKVDTLEQGLDKPPRYEHDEDKEALRWQRWFTQAIPKKHLHSPHNTQAMVDGLERTLSEDKFQDLVNIIKYHGGSGGFDDWEYNGEHDDDTYEF